MSPHLFPEVEKSQIKLIGNVAVTESGQDLGEVIDFEFDDIDYKIQKIFIGSVKGLVSGELIISAKQIIEINKEKVVVEDGTVKERKEEIWAWQAGPGLAREERNFKF